MDPVVPLISNATKGPLGIAHLPRLWLKVLLKALGRLPEGYRSGEGGFDGATFEHLGIDPLAFIAYVSQTQPSYLQCEAWVSEHASNLDPGSIAAHNQFILSRDKSQENADVQRAEIGPGAPQTRNAVLLNDVDDWTAMHRYLTGAARA